MLCIIISSICVIFFVNLDDFFTVIYMSFHEDRGFHQLRSNPYRLLGQPPAYLVAGVLVACRHVARLETSTEVARWGVSAGTSLLFTFLFFSCLNPRLGIHLSLNFILNHWNRH